MTSPNLKFQVYDECKTSLQKSVELLYDGTSELCKTKFREYMQNMVVNRTEDTDNALKKFFKGIITKMSQDSNEIYLHSNITDMLDKLA